MQLDLSTNFSSGFISLAPENNSLIYSIDWCTTLTFLYHVQPRDMWLYMWLFIHTKRTTSYLTFSEMSTHNFRPIQMYRFTQTYANKPVDIYALKDILLYLLNKIEDRVILFWIILYFIHYCDWWWRHLSVPFSQLAT